jgi:CYTH domain-containing protein
MGTEIERKYLVKGDRWKNLAQGVLYRQGYLATVGKATVRVRVIGELGYLTIKGENIGTVRSEFEYPIPVEDAEEMLNTLCDRPLIEKFRYIIPYGNLLWEVDEFLGDNAGLIIAEVELENEHQQVILPDWIDKEVTEAKYFNSNLVRLPYKQWINK